MEKYTGREIAIFTDSHALFEPTIAILEDIKKRNITEIYSLGDDIGVGPCPSEVLDLLEYYKVKSIAGNSEDYSILGIDPFKSYFNERKRISQEWTYSNLRPDQIDKLKQSKHSYDLVVGGKKIALCHFANDVRIDFGEHSTWTYQHSVNNHMPDPQKQFYYTNSDDQNKKIEILSQREGALFNGYKSANQDRLFLGKQVDYYDEIIQGHVHFKMLTEDTKVKIRTIRAAGMGYGQNEPIDFASYIIIREKEVGYDVEEILVPFDRETMLKRIKNSTMPDKEPITRFTSR